MGKNLTIGDSWAMQGAVKSDPSKAAITILVVEG